LNTLHVKTLKEEKRFCTLAGLSVLTPEVLDRSRADTHLMLDSGESVQARCSLWWSNTPTVPGHRVGIIGHYAACDAEAAIALLHLACSELAQQGCTLAIGPMDGNTYRRYGLLTQRGTEPLFFLELDNPDDWPDHFTSSGFAPLANYFSALQVGLDQEHPRVSTLAQWFGKEGGVIRNIDITHFDDELRRIYRVVIASFRDNFLASPITEMDFFDQYRLLRPYVRPELVLLAEREGEPIGFAFVIPDWLQAHRRAAIDTIVVKTLAVHPAYKSKGLGTLLAGRVREIAHNLRYTRAIHAFMHEQNLSRRISQAYGGQIIRHYTLYSKTLEGCT
jgi:GNAT superfamily N-acetyltransferase